MELSCFSSIYRINCDSIWPWVWYIAIAEDQCKIDTFQIVQRCLHRVRECNKRGVPNADIMLHPIPQSNHLSPVKGEFEGRRRGQLIGYTLGFHHLREYY